jgi:hypothetical protein
MNGAGETQKQMAEPIIKKSSLIADATTAAILMGGAAAAQTVTPELPW